MIPCLVVSLRIGSHDGIPLQLCDFRLAHPEVFFDFDFMLDFIRKTAQFGGGAAHCEASRLDGQKFDDRAIGVCGLIRALWKSLRMKENGGDG